MTHVGRETGQQTGQQTGQEMGEHGMRVRREVLGDAHVDRAVAGTTEFTAPFQDFITRYAWGEIWDRPGLTRAQRSIVTLTALAALRQDEELALHVRAALRNGLTAAQIQEVLLQVAVYAGVPAANRAFAIAQGVLAQLAADERGPGRPAGPARGRRRGRRHCAVVRTGVHVASISRYRFGNPREEAGDARRRTWVMHGAGTGGAQRRGW